MTKSLFDNPPLAPQPAAAVTPPSVPQPAQPAVAASAPVPASGSLTEDDLKRALPSHLRASVTPNLVNTLNQISTDPIVAENIRENFISYTAVLKDGKFKTEDYLSAVAYVSFKLMGHSNEDAYARTFPQRYAALIAKGASKKDISAYVSAFARGKLVNLVLEQSLVPTWVLNQDIHQKAINHLANLMVNANSEKVQAEAAIGLLTHLKKPEVKGGDLKITIDDNSGMREMRDMLGRLAQQQRELIESGQMKTIDVAASRLINKDEATDV